ncbi:major facilitator superfamily domain-containing protein [Xylogone sp. PMI_703]|nr:major facilitator superfamily domain-containing protein [Xylogone sp. PMI_703]
MSAAAIPTTPPEKNNNPGERLQGELSAYSEVTLSPNLPEQESREEPLESKEKSTLDGEDIEYPHGARLAGTTVALCLSVLCFSLDNTIIATAIPRITDEFKTINDVGWYASAYLLAGCAPQLIYGRLYTFYDIKLIYLIAMFIFEVGSLVCGVAPNSSALIVGRAIAGLGGAGIFSGAMLIISKTVPLQQRPTYTSLIGAMFGIASVIAPLIGGALTDKSTWRWCFYMNLPIGGVTIFYILFFYKSPGRAIVPVSSWKAQLKQFDIVGTFLFVPAVVCLLLALQFGGSKYPWHNGRIIALFILSGLLSIAFIIVQIWKQENATVPPRIFKQRNVWGSVVFNITLGASFFVVVYFIPIWFQAIKGASPIKSGVMNIPMVLAVIIFTFISGGGITASGYYGPFLLFSSVLSSIGVGLLTTFHVDTSHSAWIGYQVLYGIGIGAGMQVCFVVVQAALPPADIPVAMALVVFAQTLGGAIFVSVSDNIFSNLLIKNLKEIVPSVTPSIVSSAGATNLKNVIDPQFLPGVLVAYNHAITQTWYTAVALASVSIIGVAAVDWTISLKDKNIDMAAAAA